ncbi:MAG: hypothetical protein JST06_09760 [Bacteroidetes bacterium]|nr:hypothetical protein [Bacteroidota bacterium]MBS1630295.1 hypothetical protein [Bacteroidota bacterium]
MSFRRLILPACLALIVSVAFAQNKKSSPKPAAAQALPRFDAVIGDTGNVRGGNITREKFIELASQGIRLKEPKGSFIEGFTFTYGERHLYEDSIGNDKLVTDYLSEYCIGDSLSPIIKNTLPYRTKPGDTAYYDGIYVRMPDGRSTKALPMKFVIVR